MKISGRSLVVFLRYPVPGRVKTRLARVLGDDFAYRLYSMFIRDIISISQKVDAPLTIACDGEIGIEGARPFWSRDIPYFIQTGPDLGMRMYNSFSRMFSRGAQKCIIIGSDSPDLPCEIIEKSFSALEDNDIVIGPADDGGYYLIGTKEGTLDRSIFSGIQWSTPHVLTGTVERIKKAGKTYSLMDSWYDIDEPADLMKFYKNNRLNVKSSHTMKFLEENMELLNKKNYGFSPLSYNNRL